jgi:osmotically-inducible protein OsmY/uncharacterized protein YkvS
MFPDQIPGIYPDAFSRCEERGRAAASGKDLDPIQEKDVILREAIHRAFWKDDVLRAIEYGEIDVHVKNGTVYLSGHIVGAGSQSRIKNAIRTVPDIRAIKNDLVLDDKLTVDVAAALGTVEHTHDCKFFTGASHGVVSLNGLVHDETVRVLAEKCAVSNPNVRGVINHIRINGSEPQTQDQPFRQPTIGEIIYFLDGIAGVVHQVIINPNNRRVIAMTVHVKFSREQEELTALNNAEPRLLEQLIVVPMKTVRYLTKVSGFLYINSNENDQYQEFDPASFYTTNWDWKPPYPYCPDDVLFPVEYLTANTQITYGPRRLRSATVPEDSIFRDQLLANDSLGG